MSNDETKKNAVPFEEEESSDSEQQGGEAQSAPSKEQDDSENTASEQDEQDQAQGDQSAPAEGDEEESSEPEAEQEEPKPRATPAKSPAKKKQRMTPKGTPQKASSNADVGIEYQKMSSAMKKHLATQPKVQFLIPLAPNEKPGAWEPVQINGHRMVIKKGVMVTIPQQVAQILADHYQIQMEAGQEHRIANKGQDVEDALTE